LARPIWASTSSSSWSVARPRHESFYVRGVSGPLADGELDRARSWGRMLARLIVQPAQHP
jgi:hypothetical protein